MTESEAKNFGAFLSLCLQKLTHWHSRKSIYDKQALANNRPGFLIKFSDSAVTGDDLGDLKLFEYEDFRTAMHKWHLKMRKCFLKCLSSGDYMQLRNGMIILNKISEYFPLIDYMGKELELSVSKIEKREERADVKQMARSYFANLRRRKSFWVPTSKFCNQPKPISVEDEVTEMHENSSVADITESEILNEDGAIEESGEVKGETSEMDIVETSILEVNDDRWEAEGSKELEIEDSVERIVSLKSIEPNSGQEVRRLEDSQQLINIEANESKEINSKAERGGRDQSSKTERHDSSNRNSRDDRSRRDDYQRDFNNRDDGSKDSSRRDDRNQKRDDPKKDTRRDDSQKEAKRDDWNQKRDDFNRDSRRDDRVQRREDTFSRDSNRKDESIRDSSKRDEKINNRELRIDGRNDSNRNQDERGKERVYERSSNNNDRSSDTFRDEKNSRKDDGRGVNERKRPLPEETSLTSREDQRLDQRIRRDQDRSISIEGSISQSPKPKVDIADKIRQISREEKDRLLLARIDIEKRSFEQSKQAVKTDLNEAKNTADKNVVKEIQPSTEGQSEKQKIDESRSESIPNRPRFERPSRSNSKARPERAEEKNADVVAPSEPNLSEVVTSLIREDSQRSNSVNNNDDDNEISRQESKRNTLSKEQDDNNRNEVRKNSGQDSNGRRDETRKDSGSRDYQRDDFSKRGNYRHNDRRGGGGGESYGNRGGRGNGGPDRDSRRNDDQTQRKGGNQQYNRGGQRGRDDSKRGSDGMFIVL